MADEPAETKDSPTDKKSPVSLAVAELAKQTRPSIVVITSAGREGKAQGLGTGFFISSDGLIATNLHVIGEGRAITVQTVEGKSLKVTQVYASDRTLDLAVLKVDAKDLPALKLGTSATSEQGEPVVVMGNPQGLKQSVVSGVISGRRKMDDRDMLQLHVPIEPGNSGGPVLNAKGEVLGIVTMKSAVTDNLGFAVEIDSLKPLLEKPNITTIERWLTMGALDPKEWQAVGGAQWQQRGGKILVSGEGAGFGGRSLCLWQEKTPEFPFEVAVWVKLDDEAGAAGLVFHADGDKRHYGFYPSAGILRLTRFDGPDVFSWKVLAERPSPAYRLGEWNQLKVRIETGKFLCYVNGQLLVELADDGLTAGKVGLAKFRQTKAEFKRFEVGATLAAASADKLPTELSTQLEKLPKLAEVQSSDLTPFTLTGAAAAILLRKQSEVLKSRAAELERLAADLYLAEVTQRLEKLVAGEDKEIDLLQAALTIAQLDEPDVDTAAYERQIVRWVNEMKTQLPGDADEASRLTKLRQFLFAENGFHGSRADYYHRANSYLNRVIDDREGIPITLCVLYLELAKRLDLKVEGVGLPSHFVVRHLPKKGEPQLIDVFDGASPLSRDEAEKIVRQQTGKELQEADLLAMETKPILLRMLSNLLSVAQSQGDKEAMQRYVTAMLAIDPAQSRQRGLQAVLHFETGRKKMAIDDLDWFFQHKPAGIELDSIREMQDRFRNSR